MLQPFAPDPERPATTDKPVLVTGASGFLGTHLVRQLVARGYRVRALVYEPDRAAYDVEGTRHVFEAARAGALDLQRRLGIEPAPGTAEAMTRWLDEHRRDRHGRHVFDLRTFGLDPDQIGHRFADYIDRFDLGATGH